jgi:hypothetical protein
MHKLTAMAIVCGAVFAESSAYANATISLTTSPLLSDNDPVAVSGSGMGSGNVPGYQGAASGASDLRTGTVRVLSVANAASAAAGTYGAPNATAAINDSITVSGPGPTVDITVTLDVDGIATGGSPNPPTGGGVSSQSATSELGFGTTTKSVTIIHNLGIDQNNVVSEAYSANEAPAADPDITIENATAIGASAHIVIHATIKVGTPTNVGASMATFSQFGAGFDSKIDYGNTARLSISVPAGYSWSSASGALLTNAGGQGLTLPPDGGAGVHGDGTIGGGSDAGSTNDASTPNADAGPGSSSGGCDVGGSSAPSAALWALCVGLLSLRTRRKAARRDCDANDAPT